jgi:predicted esterase
MEHNIQINKTAKYVTYGNPVTAKTILFALHGYGQLAKFFIRKFNMLNENDYFVVVPEGLHRFYLNGSSGRVGASWMTKEERQSDIDDYIGYLDLLFEEIDATYSFENKTLLGFSQGGATASRWHSLGKFKADKFLLWASVFPNDMSLEFSNRFQESDNYFVLGNEDEYLSFEQGELCVDKLNQSTLEFQFVKFSGKHNIDTKTLLNLV